jgi:hypothetical protein
MGVNRMSISERPRLFDDAGEDLEAAHSVAVDTGRMRLRALVLGEPPITCAAFAGGSSGFNELQGLGSTPADRQEAVWRVLEQFPNWADRRIGEFCGISPKTVAQIRTRWSETCGRDGATATAFRIGRDGRSRPVDAAAQRTKILRALKEHPDASLRTIAARVGVSPETVRRVRLTLGDAVDKVVGPPIADLLEAICARNRTISWAPDRAFDSRDDAAHTAEFMQRTAVEEAEIPVYAGAVPLSRVYEVADEARRRAAFWTRLAERIENRARRDKS